MNKNNKEKKICNFPGCELEGDYRAPTGYESLNDYQCFAWSTLKNLIKAGIITIK